MVNDSAAVVFDDERAVADAGVVLPATLAQRLGIEALVEDCVDLGGVPGAANPGRKGGDDAERDGAGCRVHRGLRGAAQRAHGSSPPPPGRGALNPGDLPCAPSPSATCASSTGSWARRSPGPGRPERDPGRGDSSSMSTASSARCTATPSRAPPSAMTAGAATPAARHPRGDRRGAPHPHPQGLGQHLAGDRALPR